MLNTIKDRVSNFNRDVYGKFINHVLDGHHEDELGYYQLSIETCHVAKLLSRLELDLNLNSVKKTEKPDFIIEYQNNIIGIEHEIIVDQGSRKKEGSLKQLIRNIESRYRCQNPEKKLLVNIYLNDIRFKKSESPKIQNYLYSLVDTFISSGILLENDYINHISSMKHSRLDFTCNLGAWFQKPFTASLLRHAIDKKENKYQEYVSNLGSKTQWLLIVIGSLGESSYEILSISDIDIEIQTQFDRVFIMEDFKANVYELV